MPVTATVHQVNGIAGYAVNNVNVSQSGGAVGGYFQARNTANNASSFGSNSLSARHGREHRAPDDRCRI
jgi:hypothetical protein